MRGWSKAPSLAASGPAMLNQTKEYPGTSESTLWHQVGCIGWRIQAYVLPRQHQERSSSPLQPARRGKRWMTVRPGEADGRLLSVVTFRDGELWSVAVVGLVLCYSDLVFRGFLVVLVFRMLVFLASTAFFGCFETVFKFLVLRWNFPRPP